MEEERMSEAGVSGIPDENGTNLNETESYLKDSKMNIKESDEILKESFPNDSGKDEEENTGPVYGSAPDPEPEIELLKKDTKEALIIGAVLGLVIGILMFFVPSTALEEGARLTISVILILLGPRLVQDKYHLDFTKGRYTMAGALVLTLLVYILIGHPIR